MITEINKDYLKKTIIQACEEIKNITDEIINNGMDELQELHISISFPNGYDTHPTIDIQKKYTKYIPVTEEMLETLMNEENK